MNKVKLRQASVGQPITWLAVFGFGLALLCAIAALLAGPGHRLQWWHYTAGFMLLRWATYGAALSISALLLASFIAWRKKIRQWTALMLLGLVVAFVTLSMPSYWFYAAQSAPRINDISTDTENPPDFWSGPDPRLYEGPQLAALQRMAYPQVAPAILPVTPEEALEHALAAAQELGWKVVATESEEGRIEATDTTFWFGFMDDIVVRITTHEQGARVDVRSASRVGRSDAGTNARRIVTFLTHLRKRLQPSPQE